jgi:hypothetical protein
MSSEAIFRDVSWKTGQFAEDTLVFRGELSPGDVKVAIRNATGLVAPGKITSAEYVSTNGAPEALMITVGATRK